jgi:hypothetical protein
MRRKITPTFESHHEETHLHLICREINQNKRQFCAQPSRSRTRVDVMEMNEVEIKGNKD